MQDPDAQLEPPDALLAQSITWKGPLAAFRKFLGKMPTEVVRAKGFFEEESGKWMRFDFVKGSPVQYTPFRKTRHSGENLRVFIREDRKPEDIPRLFSEAGLQILDVRI